MSKYKITIKNNDGSITFEERDGIKFSHAISGKKFWFAVDPHSPPYAITHIKSGFKIGVVPYIKLQAGYSFKDAAKSFIDDLTEKHGSNKVSEKLSNAENNEVTK